MFKYIALFACLTLVAAEAVPDSSEGEWSIEGVLDAADELHDEMKALPEGRRLTETSAQYCYWYRYRSCRWWGWCYWSWGYACVRTNCAGYWAGWGGWQRGNCYGYGVRYNTWIVYRNAAYGGYGCPYYHGYRLSTGGWVYSNVCPVHCSGYWSGWGGWSRANCYGYGTRYNTWIISRNAAYGGSGCPYYHGYRQSWSAWVFYNNCPVHCSGYWGGWSGWNRANCYGYGTRYNTWYITRNRNTYGSNCPYYHGYRLSWSAWVYSNNCCTHCSGYWQGWGGWIRGNCYGYGYRANRWVISRNRNYCGSYCPYNNGHVIHAYHGWVYYNNCVVHCVGYWGGWSGWNRINCNGLGRRYSRWYITRNSAYGGNNCPYYNGYGRTWDAWVYSCTCCAVHCTGYWAGWGGWNRGNCYGYAYRSSTWYITRNRNSYGSNCPYNHGTVRHGYHGWHLSHVCPTPYPTPHPTPYPTSYPTTAPTVHNCDSGAHWCWSGDTGFGKASAKCIKNRGGHEYSCECPAGYATLRGHISHWYGTIGYRHNCQKTASPTSYPTSNPTAYPTPNPTAYPTTHPTNYPTPYPTPYPTSAPTNYPTPYPTSYPTSHPTTNTPTNPTP
jgi:hypothetical protein